MNLIEKRLFEGALPAQCHEADLMCIQIHLAPNQPMKPGFTHKEIVSQEINPPSLVRAAHVNQPPSRLGSESEVPLFREGAAHGCPSNAHLISRTMRRDETVRLGLKGRKGFMMKTAPDGPLPATVETFNGSLKAGLSLRHEDRDDPELQTKARNGTEDILILVRPLKTRVVVELGVVREARATPMLDESLQHPFGADLGFRGPGYGQAAVERDAGKDVHQRPIFDAKAFDNVEGIQFGLVGGKVGKIPAWWRSRAANAPLAVKRAAPEKNAADGANGRGLFYSSFQKLLKDGGSTEFAKIAGLFELTPELKNQIFEVSEDPPGRGPASGGTIAEIHAVKPLGARSSNPTLHRWRTYPEALCNRPDGFTMPNCTHHVSTLLFQRSFLATGDTSSINVLFTPILPRGEIRILTLLCNVNTVT